MRLVIFSAIIWAVVGLVTLVSSASADVVGVPDTKTTTVTATVSDLERGTPPPAVSVSITKIETSGGYHYTIAGVPSGHKVEYIAEQEMCTVYVVIRPKGRWDYSDFRVYGRYSYKGDGVLEPVRFKNVDRLRDGGSTFVVLADGRDTTLFFSPPSKYLTDGKKEWGGYVRERGPEWPTLSSEFTHLENRMLIDN